MIAILHCNKCQNLSIYVGFILDEQNMCNVMYEINTIYCNQADYQMEPEALYVYHF